jgi:hypothetical protein
MGSHSTCHSLSNTAFECPCCLVEAIISAFPQSVAHSRNPVHLLFWSAGEQETATDTARHQPQAAHINQAPAAPATPPFEQQTP